MINIPCEFHSAADCGSVILFRIGDLNFWGLLTGSRTLSVRGNCQSFTFIFHTCSLQLPCRKYRLKPKVGRDMWVGGSLVQRSGEPPLLLLLPLLISPRKHGQQKRDRQETNGKAKSPVQERERWTASLQLLGSVQGTEGPSTWLGWFAPSFLRGKTCV